ncbi:protein Daple-like [Phymastichus coffea]|uniref:protein Daple-like n=1 Tax=Phymastichus coffea TaxID=108790 RepID=UPI00273B3253|nr:protein Daple-like [Phymastichus coffea]
MAEVMDVRDMDKFLESPLVTWITNCLDRRDKDAMTYEELVDGVSIYDVVLQMDIDGQKTDVSPSFGEPSKRLANLDAVLHRIRHFYEDNLGEVIIRLPQVQLIAQQPRLNIREVELLLVLLLGCSVKCQNKEYFVEKITTLEKDEQMALAALISKVLYVPEIVLNEDMLIGGPENDEQSFPSHKQKVQQAIQAVYRMSQERHELLMQVRSFSAHHDVRICKKELNEWKAEATSLADELESCKRQLAAVEAHRVQLFAKLKSYRGTLEELSELTQKHEEANKEIASYKEQLKKMSPYKMRLAESEQNIRLLKEKNDNLASQMESYKEEADDKLQILKAEYCRLQQKCSELELANEMNFQQNSILYGENLDLESRITLSSSMNASSQQCYDTEDDESFQPPNNSSLSEELSQSMRSHMLKLEIEKQLETVEENSVLESSLRISHLEEEKEKRESVIADLNARVAQLEEQLVSANREKTEMKDLLKNAENLLQDLKSKDKTDEKIEKEVQVELDKYDGDHTSGNDLGESAAQSPLKQHSVKLHVQRLNDYQSLLVAKNLLESKLEEANLKLKQQSKSSEEVAPRQDDFNVLMDKYRKEKLRADDMSKHFRKQMVDRDLKIFDLTKQNRKLLTEVEILQKSVRQMESDKKITNQFLSQISEKNEELIANSFVRQQKYHEEYRKKDEKFDNLARIKTKLEERMRDMENRRVHKRSAAVTAMKNTFTKMQKASSGLFSKAARRSNADNADLQRDRILDEEPEARAQENPAAPRDNISQDIFENFDPDDFLYDDEEWHD